MLFRRLYSKSGGLGTHRLEALSDGVFGVSITLLVLAIVVPQLTSLELVDGGLGRALVSLWPRALIYVISFFVIGIYWMGHNIMFSYIERSDRVLIVLNILLLMSVSFIPFAADLLGRYPFETTALMVYGLTLAFGGLMFEIVWLYASKHHRLIRKSMSSELIRLGKLLILITPLLYAGAALIAMVNPYLTMAIFGIVPLLYIIPGPIDDLVAGAEVVQ
jgi:uncharacterized membrane protein